MRSLALASLLAIMPAAAHAQTAAQVREVMGTPVHEQYAIRPKVTLGVTYAPDGEMKAASIHAWDCTKRETVDSPDAAGAACLTEAEAWALVRKLIGGNDEVRTTGSSVDEEGNGVRMFEVGDVRISFSYNRGKLRSISVGMPRVPRVPMTPPN